MTLLLNVIPTPTSHGGELPISLVSEFPSLRVMDSDQYEASSIPTPSETEQSNLSPTIPPENGVGDWSDAVTCPKRGSSHGTVRD